jgi:hypothetical protein
MNKKHELELIKMKYLLEVYRNKEIRDRKYAYTIEELKEWFQDLYSDNNISYCFWELRDKGSYFKG